MARFKVGDKVAAPVCDVFPWKKKTRSRCGYDIGTVVATGKNKKTGMPAIKVSIPTKNSIWLKKTKKETVEKWVLCEDCDRV